MSISVTLKSSRYSCLVTPKEIDSWANQLPDVVQLPHFNKTSFRIKKKIFATLNDKKKILVVKLNEIDQSVFYSFDSKVVYPVPGAWGKQGWTCIDLKKVRKSICREAIQAYMTVSKSKANSTFQKL